MAGTVFERYELKFFITPDEYTALMEVMQEHMVPDAYPASQIYSLYYDTDSCQLIRTSLLKPSYKEKMRIRSYQPVERDEPVFVELKKKYRDMVYKRRVMMPVALAMHDIEEGTLSDCSQIGKEIRYFIQYYASIHPSMFIGYDRLAFVGRQDENLRITFDQNMVWRTCDLSLNRSEHDHLILDDDRILMEVKSSGAMPLWLVAFLSERKIYRTSFSKYGTAYLKEGGTY